MTWHMHEILESLRASVDAAYDLTRKQAGESIPFNGPELTSWRRNGESFIHEDLAADSLAYDQDRGRDVMYVLLKTAFRLGMEKALRVLVDGRESDMQTIEIAELIIRRVLTGETTLGPGAALAELDRLVALAKDPGGVGEWTVDHARETKP